MSTQHGVKDAIGIDFYDLKVIFFIIRILAIPCRAVREFGKSLFNFGSRFLSSQDKLGRISAAAH